MVRLTKAISGLVLGALVAVACGGQSLDRGGDSDDGTSGNAGNGGSENGGTSGASGSFTGGSSIGGVFTGGTSSGGTFTGGTSFGGTSSGGTPFGGTSAGGVAGTGGAAGGGGACSLPIDAGPCDAYVASYGFSQAEGRCIQFIYGGCQGNDNRFSTLADCEASCGGALGRCPPEMPMSRSTCSSEQQTCTYDFGNCLCAVMGMADCVKIDPVCNLPAEAGPSPIVIGVYNSCTCTNGAWECRVITYGGR